MKRYILGLLVAIVAVGAVAFTTVDTTPVAKDGNLIYYYHFVGNPGTENIMANWQQLNDNDEYIAIGCDGGNNHGCVIKNSTNSGTHPTSVPLSATSPKVPIQSGVNSAVINKN